MFLGSHLQRGPEGGSCRARQQAALCNQSGWRDTQVQAEYGEMVGVRLLNKEEE